MNPNQKFYLQPAGVNGGLIVVNGTEHVFDIPTFPKTLEEWKKEYTYRQYQVIAKHNLSICARTTKEMSLQTRVVERWKRIGHLVMKDPASRTLLSAPAPVNASTKSPDDQSKRPSSIVIATLEKENAALKMKVEMKEKSLAIFVEKNRKLHQDKKKLQRDKKKLKAKLRFLDKSTTSKRKEKKPELHITPLPSIDENTASPPEPQKKRNGMFSCLPRLYVPK